MLLSVIEEQAMSAYGIARLTDVAMGPEIMAYLERIDETLAAFGGHILIQAALWSGLRTRGRDT